MPQVTVLTHIVTPYQVELFDAVRQNGSLDLRVIYLADSRPHRDWKHPSLGHPALEMASANAADAVQAQSWISTSDLVVVGHYRNDLALRWIRERSRAKKPWCFWGERPGFRFGGVAGRAFRAWKLRSLLRSRAPIWGIGGWAVEGWRREFGARRRYFNVPYFSDLSRFAAAAGTRQPSAVRRILFSGSLIERKGVDLLATAFARIAASGAPVTLDLVGSGPLKGQLERDLAPFADRVTFHGFKQWQDLPRHYSEADVLCVPSRYDGWGLVVPEGLAAGLAVVATDRMGAVLDLMSGGANGWVVNAGSVESLYEALLAAVNSSAAQIEHVSKAAVASVSAHQLADGVRRFEAAVEGTLTAPG